MIKIPLKFIDNQLRVIAYLDAPNYRVRLKPISFIIDTGSSKSFLSEGEALRINFPLNCLTESEPIIRMGGSKYHLFTTKPISLLFKTNNEKLHKISLEKFSISKASKKTNEAKQESQNFPSILGTDFFIINNLVLHFNPNKQEEMFIYENKEDTEKLAEKK